jgi:hypothetical protein
MIKKIAPLLLAFAALLMAAPTACAATLYTYIYATQAHPEDEYAPAHTHDLFKAEHSVSEDRYWELRVVNSSVPTSPSNPSLINYGTTAHSSFTTGDGYFMLYMTDTGEFESGSYYTKLSWDGGNLVSPAVSFTGIGCMSDYD